MDERTAGRQPPWAPTGFVRRVDPPPLGGLLERVRAEVRARHYSRRTEKAYVAWARRYIAFHGMRHPDEMGAAEVARFLSQLATAGRVSASTQNQAFSALLFLHRVVLGRALGSLQEVARAKMPARLPVVLSKDEVARVLRRLSGPPALASYLMYGAGLRLLECLQLRVKDLDFERSQITVRDGKGMKDRVTVLPTRLAGPLQAHLAQTRRQHDLDRSDGAGSVELPGALTRKYPGAAREWVWQWVFPATRTYHDPSSGERRRHHLHESVLQRVFKDAVIAAGIQKRATCHTLRHYAGSRIMPGSAFRARPTWLSA